MVVLYSVLILYYCVVVGFFLCSVSSIMGYFSLPCRSLFVVNLAVSLPFDYFPGFTKLVFK